MKKLLRIAVVLGLVMCLGVTALADGSAQGVKVEGAVTADGQTLTVEEKATETAPTVTDAASAVVASGHAGVKAEDLTVVWAMDLHAEIPAGGSVTITFDVPNVSANQNVYVLHFENGAWVKVGEGKGSVVKATFTSLSPVAIVVEKPASAPAPSGPTSPTTGEETALLVVAAVVALLAGTVAVVTLKKKEM